MSVTELFDTRYWRIDHEKCEYIELDLPEIVELKKEILKEHLGHELMGCSVSDPSWIDRVMAKGNFLFGRAALRPCYRLARPIQPS